MSRRAAGHTRWEENPFTGTRELRGPKIMTALFENRDIKDDNNRTLAVRGARDARRLGRIPSRLSDRRIADAFRTADYTPAEVRMLPAEVGQRIGELSSVGR